MGNLDGKTAIITGAASARGMGFATARIMKQRGANLVLTDVDLAGVRSRSAELGGTVHVLHDVSSEDDWSRVIAETTRQFGGLNILVNNAGSAVMGSIERLSREMWDAQMAVNLTGPFLGCRAAVPALRASGGGAIINVSSIAGITGVPSGAAYAASKAGVRLLTKSLALELAADNIRVNSVHPGLIDTAMQDVGRKTVPDILKRMIDTVPLKRMGEPSDIGYLIAFLASEEATYVTGGEFVVDGGLTAQ